MYNIVIYDDKPTIINGLVSYFESSDSILIQACFTQVKDLLCFLENKQTDLVLLEIKTHDEIGLKLISLIHDIDNSIKIIVFTTLTKSFISEKCINCGAHGFLNKSISMNQLEINLLNILTSEAQITHTEYTHTLTKHEKSIVLHLAQGHTAKAIADILQVSPNTIHNQKNHLLKKFECANSTELIYKLIGYGYVKI